MVCVFAAACSNDSSGGPIPITALEASYHAYYCNLAVRCGLVSDLGTCSKLQLGVDISADLVAAVQAGTVAYDGTAAGECLAGITATCDRSLVLSDRDAPVACDEMFAGTVGDGGACGLDQECISGVCSVPGCSMACCQGTCLGGTAPVRPKLGESCATDSRCVSSYCDLSTQVCSAYLAAGSQCNSDNDCQLGLACHTTCIALAAEGAACTASDDCKSIGDYCNATLKCARVGVAGDACASNADCSGVYRCDTASSKCVLRPELGETCGSSPLNCVDVTYCDSQTTKCTAPKADGASCGSSSECAGGTCSFTNGSPGTCVTPPVCI